MKIVFLVSSLGSGGAERVASTLCNAWAARGDSITLVSTFSGSGRAFYEIDNRVELIYLFNLVNNCIKFKGRDKLYVQRFFALRKLILSRKPDVVVSFLPNVNVAALMATVWTGIPCIVGERSDPTVQPIGRFWTLACKILYRFADAVVVQTKNVATTIESIYPSLRKIVIIPNPLPPELSKILPKNEIDEVNNKQRRVLLTVGRLAPEKRIDLILDAFASVASKYDNWDLCIVGDGPLRQYIENQIKLSRIADRVFLLGRSDQPWVIMRQADVFVMASKYEGFPNALLEAVALGLPAISTDCRSGPREISDNGSVVRLVPVDDKNALVDELDSVLGNSDLRYKLSREGAISVRERYCLHTVLESWNNLFENF